jgi:hypothetical protein
MSATLLGADSRFAQRSIDLVNQHRGTPIGHPKMSCRRSNRAFGPNSFEQCDLAGTYAVTACKVETNGEARICHWSEPAQAMHQESVR